MQSNVLDSLSFNLIVPFATGTVTPTHIEIVRCVIGVKTWRLD